MKKFLLILAVAGFAVACSNDSETKVEEVKDSTMNVIDSTADAAKDSIDAIVDTTKSNLDSTVAPK